MSKAFENWTKELALKEGERKVNTLMFTLTLSLANDLMQLPVKERKEKLVELGII